MKTTLKKIRAHRPCGVRQSLSGAFTGYLKLQNHLGKTTSDNEEFSLLEVLNSNGLADATWCFRAVSGFEKEKRLFAVFCARQVQHLMKDPRSINAIEVAEKFANGLATKEELVKAKNTGKAAYAAASDAVSAAAATAALAAAADIETSSAAAYYAYTSANAAIGEAQRVEVEVEAEAELRRVLS